MSTDARALLAATPLLVRRGPWALGAWDPGPARDVLGALDACPGALLLWLRDERELTALCREDALDRLPPPREVQRGWAAITLDQAMTWDLTGVLATVAGALAAAGVPLAAFAAYSRDHLLVPGARLDDALAALRPVCGEVAVLD